MVSYKVFTKVLTICQKKKFGLNVVCKACVYANESTYAYVLLITLTLCFCKEFKQFDSYTTPNPPPPKDEVLFNRIFWPQFQLKTISSHFYHKLY